MSNHFRILTLLNHHNLTLDTPKRMKSLTFSPNKSHYFPNHSEQLSPRKTANFEPLLTPETKKQFRMVESWFRMFRGNRIRIRGTLLGEMVQLVMREHRLELGMSIQNYDYFKDKMLLMQAQENGAVLDEEELLFLTREQTNNFDIDVDDHPVRDLALNDDNIFQADECDAFDSDVDDEPTAQSIFMANLSSAGPTSQQACPSNALILSEFIRTVRFKNDHFGAIMGYGDYVLGDNVIYRVHYVGGLGHNLFSVGQFCDFDLEVGFRKHTCFVRDLDGVNLIKGSRGSNLYTISVEDMMRSLPICLLFKASKNKSCLWHRCLNHLNFGTINDLARKYLVRGLPRLKFEKDHMCSACQLRKSKKATHQPKMINTIMEVLYTLHMDLYRPLRVQSINGKKYILVIIDDYSRFTWVKFLRSKDKTLEFVIKLLKKLQAEDVATTSYTQNRSLIHTLHNKTPYELAHDKRLDLSFLCVFGALCYLTNDSEDLGKLKAKADIGLFVGYAPNKKGYLIYNKRTRQIMETVHVTFDELTGSGLVPNPAPAIPYVPPTKKELEILFQSMFDEYFEPSTVDQQVPLAPAVHIPVNPPCTSVYISVDQDALSTVKPKKFKPAVTKDCWFEAMQEEIHEFDRPQVWKLVPPLECAMIISLKWIYKVKLDEYGDVLKNKAHLVAKGYSQEEGIDFEESFCTDTMVDMNSAINDAFAEQAPAIAPPTRTDDQILPSHEWNARGKKKSTPLLIPSIRFTKLIIHYMKTKHNFHPRTNSRLHYSHEDFALGILRSVGKDGRETFGMPIPNALLTDEIKKAPYYSEYQEHATKYQQYLNEERGKVEEGVTKSPKATKVTKPKAAKQTKSSTPKVPKHTSSQPPASTLAQTEPSKKDQDNLALEERLDKHGSRLHNLKNLNISHQKKRKRRDLPRTPSGSPPPQPPPPPPLVGMYGAPGSAQQQGSKALTLSKSVTTTPHMAWTISDTRYESTGVFAGQESSLTDSMINDDSRNDHLPNADTRKDWWKPLPEEERSARYEKRLVETTAGFPMNKYNCLTMKTPGMITCPMQIREKTGGNHCLKKKDQRLLNLLETFHLLMCQIQRTTRLLCWFQLMNLLIEWANPGGDQVKIDVSGPLPLGGPPNMILHRVEKKSEHTCGFSVSSASKFTQDTGHLDHLPGSDKRMLSTTVKLWTRDLVIRQWVEDFQLGIKSYQTQLNFTKPGWDAKGYEFKHDYTIIESPRAVVFPVNNNARKIMRFNKIYKYNDGTLTRILEALDYRVKAFKIKLLNPMVFNSLVYSLSALSTLRRFGLRTVSAAAKRCQGDSLEFYQITSSIHTD
uniref:Integrase, catalytic region, zinc finger, CCHC-type, peptidase aspartic, catalytic n=1 Tax=Tanacetum cinerariifolium TaxID=118510 RepID=A0A6L2JGR0_TANCI|nr:integrase, catalytic region, zinc finger, CCHC-type, peptidase aspartic, catalytic [Tanacetum cinerariifolium]